MVKNSGGGNRAKGMARKNFNKSEQPLRVAKESDEMYAFVEKMNGNGMCDVFCMDGELRLCHIRGIFKGRGKRDNCIEKSSWLLVGLRSFETVAKGKKPNCDLLEVYNKSEKDKLRNAVTTVDWKPFLQRENLNSNIEEDLDQGFGIRFADATEQEYLDLMTKLKTANPGKTENEILESGQMDEAIYDDL
jgi:initiation factor 1A